MPASYLSPTRYRNADFGIDVTSFTDSQLARHLARATTTVNRACNRPSQPAAYDFRGGSITDEQHQWNLGDPMLITQGSRRVYVNNRPLNTITAFSVDFTNTYNVAIAPANLYVNHIEGWAEVVSLAAIVTGIYPVGINFGLYTPIARVSYTYGYTFAVTGDALYPTVSDSVFEATHGSWATSPAPVIYIGGSVQSSGFTIDYATGGVTFTSSVPTAAVTADYTYLIPDAVEEATGIIATDFLAQRAIAARGLIGLSSVKIAELAITKAAPKTKMNGEIIPETAALLLESFQQIAI